MRITAVCPGCRTCYKLEADLRGKPIRCPNPGCRRTFLVSDAASPPPPNGQRAGTVGDLVPILPAEEAVQPDVALPPPPYPPVPGPEVFPLAEAGPVPSPEPAPSWLEPPPVRRNRPRPPTPPPPAPTVAEPPPAEEPPAVVHQSWEQPPPIRRPGASELPPARTDEKHEEPIPPPLDEEPAPPPHEEPYPEAPLPRKKRRAWFLMAGMIAGVVAVLGGGAWLVIILLGQSEAELARHAADTYQLGQFRRAEEEYRGIVERFPQSENLPKYHFLQELSAFRAQVRETLDETAPALEQVEAFLQQHAKDPTFGEHAADVGTTLVSVVDAFAEREKKPAGTGPLEVVARAQPVVKLARAKKALSAEQKKQIEGQFETVRGAVARWQERDAVRRELERRAKGPPADAIRAVQSAIKEHARKFPGLAGEAEVQKLLNDLYGRHLAGVRYERGGEGMEPPGPRAGGLPEAGETSLLFDPLLRGSPGGADDVPTVLAQVRGVLYGLKRANGEVKWAMRVGVDSTQLPVRVPATLASPERILVLSADTETLTALDRDGVPLWRYRLGSPCLGQPLVVGPRAYLPTYDGQVHEIELAEGKLLGRYQLGQHLTTGGAIDGAIGPNRRGRSASSQRVRLYFPADDSCVYVLDPAARRCETILYTGHPAGALRSAPLVVPAAGTVPGFLILNQAHGLDAVELKVYALPLRDRRQAPLALAPPARIPGWTWFRPAHDAEKVVALSDAGVLGLFGIQQSHNLDQALFPLLGPGGLSLEPFLRPRTAARGRAQVVRLQGDDLWVLARGRLQRLQLAWSGQQGRKPVPVWDAPIELGSPLHVAQLDEDPRTGRATLYLVTQALDRPACLATAVDDEDGRSRWQRQLGMVAQGDPLVLKPAPRSHPPGGKPVGGGRERDTTEGVGIVLVQDQTGALFMVDPERFPARDAGPWQSGGQEVLLAHGLDDNPDAPPVLLPAADGRSAYQVSCPGAGREAVVRHVRFAQGRRLKVDEGHAELPAALAGTPAVMAGWLVLPLADGTLARLPLPLPVNARYEIGDDWRTPQAPPAARGHVLALGGDRFLTTDGGRGLTCWTWPAAKGAPWNALPLNETPPTLELADRVVGVPLLLPTGPDGAAPRVCVADAAGVVGVLDVHPNGRLEAKRTWKLDGVVTAGPFRCDLPNDALRIGCVVDGTKLVWLDPARDEPLWQYPAPRGEHLVGLPRLVEGVLVVALRSGHFLALDPHTGQPLAKGHRLRGSLAPASAPVPFGAGRLFAPLSDGTVLLLSLDRLRKSGQGTD